MHSKLTTSIMTLAVSLLTALLLAGCADDDLFGGSDRSPVTLELRVAVPGMNVMTRSEMMEGLDQRVETLWIGVYDAATGERTGWVEVTDPVSAAHNPNEATVSLNAVTGRSYIVAVANYTGLMAHDGNGARPLAQALGDADSWEKYTALSVMTDENGGINTDVPLNALPMSGHYMSGTHADGSYAGIVPVNIPSDGRLGGSVHLRRLISHISFNVTCDPGTVADFEVVGWTVHNVPNQSWLAERVSGTLNAGDLRTVAGHPSYQPTVQSSLVSKEGNTWRFDWWQMENKRTGRQPDGADTDDYRYREREWKDASGANTGRYVSLVDSPTSTDPANNATFVELRVRMRLKVDENGNPLKDVATRVFDGVYTVHLGYCEGEGTARARDFNSRRNTRYTYNLTVRNVGDVLVEARREGEVTPGAEGIVSDVTDSFVGLDAHYCVYNIHLSDRDLERFDYMIRCYDGNSAPVYIDSQTPSTVPGASSANRKYLTWVEIRPTDSKDVLSAYKPHEGTHSDGKTMYLDEFKAGIDKGSVGTGYYTVFFNEYVYETRADGNEDASVAWREYVNKPDRQLWIRVLEQKSADGESTYFASKYAFSQRSIQTYYDISPTGATEALGVEHENESYGLNLRVSGTNPHSGMVPENGRYNLAKYIRGNNNWRDNYFRWSNYIDLTAVQDVNAIDNVQGVSRQAGTYAVPKIKGMSGTRTTYDPDQSTSPNFIDARRACLNRNRDLDGDGYIDAGELRWYIPTSFQYIRVILGRRSLTTPIMDFAGNSQLASKINEDLPSLVIYGSNGSSIWAMEGTSTSDWGDKQYYHGTPWNIRCVRNLGTDMTAISSGGKVTPAFRARSGAKNTVELVYYDSKSVRQEKMLRIYPHDIADQDYNRCYKAFEYSEPLKVSDLNGYKEYGSDWADWLRKVNPCAGVKRLEGDGWRLPNQKEITIMMTLGIKPTSQYMPSATFTHYDNSGKGLTSTSLLNVNDFKIMCITVYGNATQQPWSAIGDSDVRCVRDVD